MSEVTAMRYVVMLVPHGCGWLLYAHTKELTSSGGGAESSKGEADKVGSRLNASDERAEEIERV
jgi:hypothetical protein